MANIYYSHAFEYEFNLSLFYTVAKVFGNVTLLVPICFALPSEYISCISDSQSRNMPRSFIKSRLS